MTKRLLVILVDGCREDYISKVHMPFTSDLYERNTHSSLETILGYSNAIRATAFTGTLPSTHGRWCNFAYDPPNSPYREIQHLGFLDHLPVDIAKRASKFFLSKTLMKTIASRKGHHSLELGNIPIHLLQNFIFTGTDTQSVGTREVLSLFEVLAQNGMRYKYVEFPYLTRSRHIRLLQDSLKDNDVLIVYLPHLDGAAHWFGISSQRFGRKLEYVDKLVGRLFAIARERWGSDFDFLLFSDHGMCDVHEYIDFFDISTRWERRLNEDYDVFLDSTMARFWYKDDHVKDDVGRLAQGLNGHFLTSSEIKQFGIAFEHNRYGDDIFLLEPGSVFFPCYLSWVRPKAMHGYSPVSRSQHGVVILRSDSVERRTFSSARMVDIMPTLLDMLDLEIPSSCEGKSLLMGRQ
ncbi:MAG: alkaline phosphatase family protein [Thermoplasmata archaeon]